METLRFPNKRLRAEVIRDYVQKAGFKGCVCFSCGNASAALKEEGLDVVDISPRGDLLPRRWWQPEEIARVFQGYFDATSGHLPAFLMVRIAEAFREHLGDLSDSGYLVPTGSGETIIALRWAYPKIEFIPITDGTPATEQHDEAPLLAVSYGALDEGND